jgi:hypothetical protein
MAEEEKPTAESPAATTEKPQPTSEEFITKWPLYTPFACPNGYTAPESVSLDCPGECRKETTWHQIRRESVIENIPTAARFYWVGYQCGRCKQKHLLVMYRDHHTEMRPRRRVISSGLTGRPASSLPRVQVVTQVQKIGQFPPLSIAIPKALEKNLGEDAAALYKKALINRNEGNGLAAVTYIRRVVEDKTEELIEVVAQLAEAHNVDLETVKNIRAAASERTTYDQKLKLAATVLPASLVIDGANPLGVIYGLVSMGLHSLSEEKCVAVADETKLMFEFTFTHLRAETQHRHKFVEQVKKLAGERGKTEAK